MENSRVDVNPVFVSFSASKYHLAYQNGRITHHRPSRFDKEIQIGNEGHVFLQGLVYNVTVGLYGFDLPNVLDGHSASEVQHPEVYTLRSEGLEDLRGILYGVVPAVDVVVLGTYVKADAVRIEPELIGVFEDRDNMVDIRSKLP